MRKKTPSHLEPFAEGQLCFVLYRRYKGKGPYRLLLHAAEATGKKAHRFGDGALWVVPAPESVARP